MKRILPIALLVGLALWATGSSADEAPPKIDPIEPDLDAEAQACASAVADKPEIEMGVARNGRDLDLWLTMVAFARVYGRWPDPANAVDVARAQAISACVKERLEAESKGLGEDGPPDIADVPTPGKWYRIRYGDTLFEISKAAFPAGVSLDGKPPSNYQAGRWINEASENKRFWRIVDSEKALFPQGRITFLPRFGTFEQQRADPVKGGEVGAGGGYAVIWIPPPPG